MVDEGRMLFDGLGKPVIKCLPQEECQKKFRRSIYVSKDIKKGEFLSKDNLKIVRPNFGLHPRYWEQILGQKAKTDMSFGHPLSLNDVEV